MTKILPKGFLLTVVQNLKGSLVLMRKTNNFRDGLLGLGQGAKSGRIGVGVHLLYELERNKIDDKGLLVEDHNHHVLAQLDVHNELIGVEGNLCPIFLLVVVPNDNFVPLLLVD